METVLSARSRSLSFNFVCFSLPRIFAASPRTTSSLASFNENSLSEKYKSFPSFPLKQQKKSVDSSVSEACKSKKGRVGEKRYRNIWNMMKKIFEMKGEKVAAYKEDEGTFSTWWDLYLFLLLSTRLHSPLLSCFCASRAAFSTIFDASDRELHPSTRNVNSAQHSRMTMIFIFRFSCEWIWNMLITLWCRIKFYDSNLFWCWECLSVSWIFIEAIVIAYSQTHTHPPPAAQRRVCDEILE